MVLANKSWDFFDLFGMLNKQGGFKLTKMRWWMVQIGLLNHGSLFKLTKLVD
jgi:hypothetical protein